MSSTSPTRNRPARILVAEDDAVTRRLITFKLQREGHQVEAVTNGEELLKQVDAATPELVILDIMMPVQDGYTTLRQLKERPGLADLPVIMLTGKSDEEEVLRCLNSGASDYMVKPFSPDELLVRVRKLLAP